MDIEEVDAWARSRDVDEPTRERALRRGLATSAARLLESMRREQWTATRLRADGEGRAWLLVGASTGPQLRVRVDPLPFGRLELVGPIVLAVDGVDREVRTLAGLSTALRRCLTDVDHDVVARVCSDLADSVANLYLNHLLAEVNRATPDRPEPAFEGHSIHPFPGLRTRVSAGQVAAFSNLGGAARVPLLQLDQHVYCSPEVADEAELVARWAGEAGAAPGVLPVHPWQVAHSDVVRGALALGLLRDTGLSVEAVPLASQRTVRIRATGYDVKLPVDIDITSERRLLYPANVANAPVVSQLLRAMLRTVDEPRLDFQYDVASVTHRDHRIGSHVAAIFRGPLPTGVDAWPALLLWSGHTALHALDITGRERAVEVFRDYCSALLPGPLRMFAAWGVGLEPHLQNTLVRLVDRRPCSIMLRDLDSTVLDRGSALPVLDELGLRLPIEPWTAMPTADVAARRLVHALLPAHLAHVIAYLRRRTGADTEALTGLVTDCWQEIERQHTGAERRRIAVLRSDWCTVKELLAMRVQRSSSMTFAG